MNGPRERLPNNELEHLENQIAAANRITRVAAQAAENVNDLETLEFLDDISATADRIRVRAISWMHRRKHDKGNSTNTKQDDSCK